MPRDEENPGHFMEPANLPEGKDRRRIPRIESGNKILWSYASNPHFPEYEGVLIDSNRLGIGFISDKPLKEGKVVRLKAKWLWDGYRHATVMRCNQLDNESFSTGILFTVALDFM